MTGRKIRLTLASLNKQLSLIPMSITLIVAQSIDGFITRHDSGGANWTSPADKKWFRHCLTGFDAQVMASKTYDSARAGILANRSTGAFRIVMTRDPVRYQTDHLAGKLEFSAAAPSEIIERLQQEGCTKCALLGGAFAHDAFLEAGLVDELWITLEPRLFGSGTPVVSAKQDRRLELIHHERLPESDSLLLKYRVRP